MPLTIEHAESAYLGATARHKKWAAAFIKQWNAPVADAVMVTWWQTVPAEVKAQAKVANPQGYAMIEKKITGLMQARGG